MHSAISKFLPTSVLAIMLLFAFSVKAEAAETLAIDGKEIQITLPTDYRPAHQAVAETVARLYTQNMPRLKVWTYTRAIDEAKLRSWGDDRIQAYIAVTHMPEPDRKEYTTQTFAEVLKGFSDARASVKTTVAELKKQLNSYPTLADGGVNAIAFVEEEPTHSLWITAVDGEESTENKREIMLAAELLMLKDSKPMMVFFFRFYKEPKDLQTLLADVGAFKAANISK